MPGNAAGLTVGSALSTISVMSYNGWIVLDPQSCFGRPTICGRRATVGNTLSYLASEMRRLKLLSPRCLAECRSLPVEAV